MLLETMSTEVGGSNLWSLETEVPELIYIGKMTIGQTQFSGERKGAKDTVLAMSGFFLKRKKFKN